MNWTQIEGRWKEFKGDVRTKWGKLTDDDIDMVGGKKDKLVGRLQQLYGSKREDLEKEVDQWLDKVEAKTDTPRY